MNNVCNVCNSHAGHVTFPNEQQSVIVSSGETYPIKEETEKREKPQNEAIMKHGNSFPRAGAMMFKH